MEHVITVWWDLSSFLSFFSISYACRLRTTRLQGQTFFSHFPILLFYYLLIIIDKQRIYVKLFYHCCNFCHVSYAAISQWFLLFSGGASKYQSWRCVDGKKNLGLFFHEFIWKFPPNSLNYEGVEDFSFCTNF